RLAACSIVPIAPSRTRMRSSKAWRSRLMRPWYRARVSGFQTLTAIAGRRKVVTSLHYSRDDDENGVARGESEVLEGDSSGESRGRGRFDRAREADRCDPAARARERRRRRVATPRSRRSAATGDEAGTDGSLLPDP